MPRPNGPGDSVKVARAIKESGRTQAEIAEGIGVSRNSVCQYVNQARKPAAGRLARLARVLGIDVKSLYRDDVN